ncbi:ABC transporter permease [Corynebacterium sp. H128]|uniref:ABC transporter permease n=1 Tax=unclassified Corynebacterium TaxID=2624378 RepID=UPI0030B4168E
MISLIRNEWIKIQKENSLWFAFVLHIAPLFMVLVAAIMKSVRLGSNLYFILYNQSMLVTGLVACVVTSIVFHLEFNNRTWFDWLTQPQGPRRLLVAKVLTGALILACYIAISAVLMLVFLYATGVRDDPARMLCSYLVFQVGTMGVMVAVSAALCVLTRSAVVVNVVGVIVTMVTVVVMAAEFSWSIPTAWPYRTGLAIIDPEYGFGSVKPLLAGGAITGAFVVMCLLIAIQWVSRPSVINAAMR